MAIGKNSLKKEEEYWKSVKNDFEERAEAFFNEAMNRALDPGLSDNKRLRILNEARGNIHEMDADYRSRNRKRSGLIEGLLLQITDYHSIYQHKRLQNSDYNLKTAITRLAVEEFCLKEGQTVSLKTKKEIATRAGMNTEPVKGVEFGNKHPAYHLVSKILSELGYKKKPSP